MDAQQQSEDKTYDEARDQLKGFLEGFQEDDAFTGRPVFKYLELLQKIANRTERVLHIDLEDVYDYVGDDVAEAIRKNTLRYTEIFAEAIDECMPPATTDVGEEDIADILHRTRASNQAADAASGDAQQCVPKELMRRYEVRIQPRTKDKILPLREVKADRIGSLLTVKGIVTRVGEVKPQMRVATYTCDRGGYEVYQDIKQTKFMPLSMCPVEGCCNRQGRLQLQTRGSKFDKFQEIKIQEEADEVPTGHVPRLMTVHLCGELTRACSAGDIVTVTGIFLPQVSTGFKALKAGLVTDTFLKATSVVAHKKSYQDYMPDEETQAFIREKEGEDMYTQMAQSIAPEIFGHEDVKKALLLLMVGGPTRQMKDGMRIRGDINVCLMGDPGVAKSQLLKQVASLAPRSVYTTGKGSSGVGLTAAVIRDTVTGDLVLEGGALVLADMGICCIDEFDKMEEADRTAIHEVMEQQTVSIAKAGITTTLNARTSVLAAANPAYSRYNPSKSPEENIQLPAALLSRFDLLWLILDKPSKTHDLELARHVTYVHQFGHHPDLDFETLKPEMMRAFISHVRQFEPTVPDEVAAYIVDEYVNMRQEAVADTKGFGFTSARTLLAIMRLSQALARVNLRGHVIREDIVEARRLMSLSRASVANAGEEDEEKKDRTDAVSDVYRLIRNLADKAVAISIADVLPRVLSRGYTRNDLEQCLEEYKQLNVWHIEANNTVIRFVNSH
uniref:DNA replication licensing factor MCM7 n=1 Tax=Chrysotila carterae TaxID=13221 RepID=A0A7S4FAD0_CHRCT|mmetsp:Transcript_57410/g.124763  ORF Transcript_57410/g.124763 Transcript_57410/m.124763 type:complete len:729 (-) Transcript_57410:456-2642(-)